MEVINVLNNPTVAANRAIEELKMGNLIIYPTETCYGLGVDTTNQSAVNKLFKYKGNRKNQVAIAVNNKDMASIYVEINELADNIYNNLLPGPITVVSKSLHSTIKNLESPRQTLGVRIPDFTWTLDLISKFGKAITTTSANTSGKKQPYSLKDWQKYTSVNKQQYISLFLDAGHLGNRPTSTVIDTTLNQPTILRQGELSLKDITSPPQFSNTPQQTQKIATKILATSLSKSSTPLIIALQGDLGAGKTQFTKGIAKFLKIKEEITSPTYTIMKEYPYDKGILYHIDTWRLEDNENILNSLNINSLLTKGNIIAIEWLQKAQKTLKILARKYPVLWIDIAENGEKSRIIRHRLDLPKS